MRQVTIQMAERSTVSAEGRIVIPASIRKQAGLQAGDMVTFKVEADGTIRLRTRAQAIGRLQAMFKDVDHSLVDELIAERRAEAAKEAAGSGASTGLEQGR